jgi:MYXO-CTERM domain-containing protein
MTRVLGYWLGLVGCCSLPALALAQSNGTNTNTPTTSSNSTGTIPVQLLRLDGVDYNDLQSIPVNKAQCDKDAEITFRLTMLAQLPNSAKFLQLWQGNSCNQSSSRDGEGTGTDCKEIPVPDDWRFTGVATNESDFTTGVQSICDIGDGALNLYFLPAENTSDNSDVAIYGQYKLEIDKSPPNAPINVQAGAGETRIPIEWTIGDREEIANNLLIWDTAPVSGSAVEDGGPGSGDEECNSAILKEGDDYDPDALANFDSIRTKEVVGNVSSTTVSASDLGASRVAIAVIAEDLATNRSKISNVDCLKVVPTSGFWDAYKASGGEADPGCACSTPGTRASFGSSIWPLALVALAWAVRRRSRKGSRS